MTSSRCLVLALMLTSAQHAQSAVLPDGAYRIATPESLMADLPKYLDLYTSEVEQLGHLARQIEAHLQAVQFNPSQTRFIGCVLPLRCGFGCRCNLAIGCLVQGTAAFSTVSCCSGYKLTIAANRLETKSHSPPNSVSHHRTRTIQRPL
jgi:hypothetical protein